MFNPTVSIMTPAQVQEPHVEIITDMKEMIPKLQHILLDEMGMSRPSESSILAARVTTDMHAASRVETVHFHLCHPYATVTPSKHNPFSSPVSSSCPSPCDVDANLRVVVATHRPSARGASPTARLVRRRVTLSTRLV